MILATLGPAGTCSEDVGRRYLKDRGIFDPACLKLCDSFEKAVSCVLDKAADEVLIPAAYTDYHELCFANLDRLRLSDILYSRPRFLLVSTSDVTPNQSNVPQVACHKSPSPLLRQLTFNCRHLEASSNAVAAWMVRNGEADLGVVNEQSVRVINAQSRDGRQLHVLRDFGQVDMIWAVFRRAKANDLHSALWADPFLTALVCTQAAIAS